MPECVILFRVPLTGLVDGVLDDNAAEFRVFDNRQQASKYVVEQQPDVTCGNIVLQIVELNDAMSTPQMRAALHARDP